MSPIGRRWLLTLGALSAFGPLSMDLYLPGLPQLARDLNASEVAAQMSLSLCMVGLACGQLVAGPLSDRVGRLRPLIVGVTLFAVTSLLCAMAPTIEVLLALRLLNGLAGGAGIVIARAMVRDRFSGSDAARVFSLLTAVLGVAPVIAPLLGSQALRLTDWRGVFGLLTAIGVALVFAASTLPETLPSDRRHGGGLGTIGHTVATLVRDRAFVGSALVLALGMCTMFTYIAMGSFVLQDGYRLSAQVYGLMFAANAAGIVLMGRIGALLVKRLGPRRLLTAGVLIAVVSAVALLLGVLTSTSVWAVLVPLLFVVSSVGLIMPNGIALALARHGRPAGTASALLGLVHFGVGALVPPAVASVFGVTPLVMAATILGTSLAAALVLASAHHALVE
ncbi:multidrug effflux MFS transporter [Actinophytocola sp.]|uniref:multidrug effflux MFS transporter n=1 Tax=Actinophytocola sp. TaxID=1872138 RepID=UPI002ED4E303